MTLAPDFPIFTAGGKRWYELGDDWRALVAAEIRRELARRAAFYPRYVAKGRMLQGEADRELAVFEEIARDHEIDDNPPVIAWGDKVRALRRELALRRAVYPAAIAKGSLDAADAARQMMLLEAALGHYWSTGWQMEGAGDQARAETAARDAWAREHGYDPMSPPVAAAFETGDWAGVPKAIAA